MGLVEMWVVDDMCWLEGASVRVPDAVPSMVILL
jgi:hypothetical protein